MNYDSLFIIILKKHHSLLEFSREDGDCFLNTDATLTENSAEITYQNAYIVLLREIFVTFRGLFAIHSCITMFAAQELLIE